MTVVAETKPTIDTLQNELDELDTLRLSLEASISNLQAVTRYHSTDADRAQLDQLNADLDGVLNEITGITKQVADLTASDEKERQSQIKKKKKRQCQMAENLVDLARNAMAARSEIAERRAELLPELISILERFDATVQAYRAGHSEFVDACVQLNEADSGVMGAHRASPALTGMLDRLNAEQPGQDLVEPMPPDGARRLLKVAEHLLQPKLFEQKQFGLNNR